MRATTKSIADAAFAWMKNGTTAGTCWVVVEDEAEGLDASLRLTQNFSATEHVEIPYDTLPTQVANAHNGRRVFVLSQPNHIPTVQVSMQDALARPEEDQLSSLEQQYGDLLGVSGLENKYLLDASGGERPSQIPTVILIDQTWPMWNELVGFLGESKLWFTDRVEQKTPPDKLAPSGQFEPAG